MNSIESDELITPEFVPLTKGDIIQHPVVLYMMSAKKKFNPFPTTTAIIVYDKTRGKTRSSEWYRFALFVLWTIWDDAKDSKITPDERYQELYEKQGVESLGENDCRLSADEYIESLRKKVQSAPDIFNSLHKQFFSNAKLETYVFVPTFLLLLALLVFLETSDIIPKNNILMQVIEFASLFIIPVVVTSTVVKFKAKS